MTATGLHNFNQDLAIHPGPGRGTAVPKWRTVDNLNMAVRERNAGSGTVADRGGARSGLPHQPNARPTGPSPNAATGSTPPSGR